MLFDWEKFGEFGKWNDFDKDKTSSALKEFDPTDGIVGWYADKEEFEKKIKLIIDDKRL